MTPAGERAVAIVGCSLCDLVDYVHALSDLAECSVCAVQMREVLCMMKNWLPAESGCMALAMERTPSVCFKSFLKPFWGKFALDIVAQAAHAGSVRTAALNHKAVDDAVEDQSVIVAFLDQADKIVYRIWCDLRIELCLHDIAIFISIVTIGFDIVYLFLPCMRAGEIRSSLL